MNPENQATIEGLESAPAEDTGANVPRETETPETDDSGPVDSDTIDESAPYGRKADGTPRKKPGRKGAGEAQRERLTAVKPAPPRIANSAPPAQAPDPGPDSSFQSDTASVPRPDYQVLGQFAASMFFNVGVGVFGPDWEPDTKAGEHKQVAGAFASYFESQEMADITPGWALVFVLGGYGLKRVQKPTVRERAASAWTWVKGKMMGFRRG